MSDGVDWMRLWRIFLAIAGIALLIFGASRLFTKVPLTMLVWVAVWLVAAVIIHDGILSPLVLTIGAAVRRFVPDRGRRYLQAGLIMAAIVTVIAVPLIFRRGTQPPSKTQVLQDYALNWGLLLGVIGAAMLILYAIRVARDKSLSSG
jgi:hypothetical protein